MNIMKICLNFLVVLYLFSACSTESKRPQTALDTGREFIRATLDGDLDRAETYLAADSLNKRIFASYREYYKTLKADQKNAYRKASYTVNSYRDLNDSAAVINYSNDYMKKPMDIKVIRQNGQWNIDFSYTSGDSVSE